MTCGDGGTRSEGQNTDSLKGGIIRLTGEGEIPTGDAFTMIQMAFVATKQAKSVVKSVRAMPLDFAIHGEWQWTRTRKETKYGSTTWMVFIPPGKR